MYFLFFFFFFKQKTAYEMRISDWSSDVCSSDLLGHAAVGVGDVEEAVQQLLQHGRVVGEHAGELACVGLEAAGVLARLVEHPADVLHLVGGDAEHLLEGVHLLAVDVAVGLGELGAQPDDADGEGASSEEYTAELPSLM